MVPLNQTRNLSLLEHSYAIFILQLPYLLCRLLYTLHYFTCCFYYVLFYIITINLLIFNTVNTVAVFLTVILLASQK